MGFFDFLKKKTVINTLDVSFAKTAISKEKVGLTIENYADEFEILNKKYYEYKENMPDILLQVKKEINKTVITRGEIFDFLSYESECCGMKCNGEVHPFVFESDDCYKYHYDEKQRLIMIEQYSVYFKKFRITDLFFYHNDFVERLNFSSELLYSLIVKMEEQNICTLALKYSTGNSDKYALEKFIYENGALKERQYISDKPIFTQTYKFTFEKDKLVSIVSVYPSGGTRLCYTTKRPNFKKIKETVFKCLKEEVLKHDKEYTAVGLEGFLDQGEPDFCLCFENKEEPSGLLAEWDCKMITIPVYDFFFSGEQLKKCVKMISEILVELTEEKVIDNKMIYFHQNQVPVTEKFRSTKAIFNKANLTIK